MFACSVSDQMMLDYFPNSLIVYLPYLCNLDSAKAKPATPFLFPSFVKG